MAQPETLQYLCGLIGTREYTTKKSLAKVICDRFGFYDTRGQVQYGGCIKALRELETSGHFVLPSAQVRSHNYSPQRLHAPVPVPLDLPKQVGNVRGLKLVLVGESNQMCLWNEMMITVHPQGAGPLVGANCDILLNLIMDCSEALLLPPQPCTWPTVVHGSAGMMSNVGHTYSITWD